MQAVHAQNRSEDEYTRYELSLQSESVLSVFSVASHHDSIFVEQRQIIIVIR